MSAAIGATFLAVFLIWRTKLPQLFSDNDEVVSEEGKLGYLLATTIFVNIIQPLLSGSGWQSLVAFINIGFYYLVGLPLGALLRWPSTGSNRGGYRCVVAENVTSDTVRPNLTKMDRRIEPSNSLAPCLQYLSQLFLKIGSLLVT